MQRQRGELVPIGDTLADLDGPVKALHQNPAPQRGFTLADQVNQLVLRLPPLDLGRLPCPPIYTTENPVSS